MTLGTRALKVSAARPLEQHPAAPEPSANGSDERVIGARAVTYQVIRENVPSSLLEQHQIEWARLAVEQQARFHDAIALQERRFAVFCDEYGLNPDALPKFGVYLRNEPGGAARFSVGVNEAHVSIQPFHVAYGTVETVAELICHERIHACLSKTDIRLSPDYIIIRSGFSLKRTRRLGSFPRRDVRIAQSVAVTLSRGWRLSSAIGYLVSGNIAPLVALIAGPRRALSDRVGAMIGLFDKRQHGMAALAAVLSMTLARGGDSDPLTVSMQINQTEAERTTALDEAFTEFLTLLIMGGRAAKSLCGYAELAENVVRLYNAMPDCLAAPFIRAIIAAKRAGSTNLLVEFFRAEPLNVSMSSHAMRALDFSQLHARLEEAFPDGAKERLASPLAAEEAELKEMLAETERLKLLIAQNNGCGEVGPSQRTQLP